MDQNELIFGFVRNLVPSHAFENPDASLFNAQILDSMALAELIGFLEDEFEITVSPMEITPDNLDSVSRISGFVSRKQGRV